MIAPPDEPIDPTADGADESISAADLDARLAAHRRAARLAAFVGRLAVPLAVAVTAGGVAVLFLRLFDRPAEPAWWGLAAASLAACGFAAVRSEKDAPTARDDAAAIDRRLRAGGLLMALADLPADRRPAAWLTRLDPRRDRWADARPFPPVGRFAKALAVPAAFAVLAAAVPVRPPAESRTAAGRGAAGAELTGELRGTLDALRAAGGGDPVALAEVAGQMASLAAAIGPDGPTGAQWEAADSLRDRLLAAGAGAGAAALADPEFMAGAGRATELIGDFAGMIEESGFRDSDLIAGLMNDSAALSQSLMVSGFDADALAQFRELTGSGVGGVAEVVGNLTAEQKSRLAAAAAGSLAAGGGPGELVENLPPELLAGVFDAVGRSHPELLAKLAEVEPGSVPDRIPSPPAVPPPGITDQAREFGAAAAAKLPPSVAAAGGVVGTLLGGGVPGLDRLTGAAPPRPAATTSPSRTEPPAPAPSRKLAAGRPVPPRLRGVVGRYFAAAVGGADTAAGVAGAGGSGQTPATPE